MKVSMIQLKANQRHTKVATDFVKIPQSKFPDNIHIEKNVQVKKVFSEMVTDKTID